MRGRSGSVISFDRFSDFEIDDLANLSMNDQRWTLNRWGSVVVKIDEGIFAVLITRVIFRRAFWYCKTRGLCNCPSWYLRDVLLFPRYIYSIHYYREKIGLARKTESNEEHRSIENETRDIHLDFICKTFTRKECLRYLINHSNRYLGVYTTAYASEICLNIAVIRINQIDARLLKVNSLAQICKRRE